MPDCKCEQPPSNMAYVGMCSLNAVTSCWLLPIAMGHLVLTNSLPISMVFVL
jgi:hypothetical protein